MLGCEYITESVTMFFRFSPFVSIEENIQMSVTSSEILPKRSLKHPERYLFYHLGSFSDRLGYGWILFT